MEPTATRPPVQPPAPWGSPRTPLLPRWYIDNLSEVHLPPAFCGAVGSTSPLRFVGDLARFWDHRSEPLRSDVLNHLIRLALTHRPPKDLVVIHSGTDLQRLLRCPVRLRTRVGITRAFPGGAAKPDQPMTVADFTKVLDFGFISLLDLMCVAEAAVESGFLARPLPTRSADTPPSAPESLDPLDTSNISWDSAWDSAIPMLKRLLGASFEFRGAVTLTDALDSDLGELARALNLTEASDAIPVADLAHNQTLAAEALTAVTNVWERLSAAERLTVEERLLARKPLTFREIGEAANASPERIRQLLKGIQRDLSDPGGPVATIAVIASLVRPQIGSITTEARFEDHISEIFSNTPKTPHLSDANDRGQRDFGSADEIDLARHMLKQELSYTHADGVCLDSVAAAVVQGIQSAAKSIADEVGLIDEAELKTHLPNDSWSQHWDALPKASGLCRLSDQLALRDTAKARTKAALLSIGHPATKEEIGMRSGLKPNQVSTYLSSLSEIVRADKFRWGLAEWIEDEYEGIPAEIIQRIDEDGGSTRLNRLLEELPRLFKVSQNSVRAMIATPAFRLEHGWVRLADEPDVLIGKLRDVVHGFDTQGDPYWTFEVEERYFRGYSVRGVPPEVAIALGCEFGGNTTVKLRVPEQCADISVIWRKTAITGPEIGRIAQALATIGVSHGDTACLTIHHEDAVSISRFSHTHHSSFSLASRNTTGEEAVLGQQASRFVREPQVGVQMGKPIRGRLSLSDKTNPHREADNPRTSFRNDSTEGF